MQSFPYIAKLVSLRRENIKMLPEVFFILILEQTNNVIKKTLPVHVLMFKYYSITVNVLNSDNHLFITAPVTLFKSCE